MEKNNLLVERPIKCRIRYKYILDKAFKEVTLLASIISVLILAFFLGGIFLKGYRWLDWQFLTGVPSRFPEKAGILPALIGSVWLVILTAAFAIPLGIAAAIYLEEYSKKGVLSDLINLNISNLAGVPSIIYGIIGLAVFVRFLAFDRSILSGALTMSLLILPVIIITSQEAIKAVPRDQWEASLALGATKWQTIRHAVLPSAFPGIITGIILALARAIGETAPLITIGALAFIVNIPRTPMDPFTVLPIQIYNWASRPQKEFSEVAAAAIIVLLLLYLILNATAVIFRKKTEKRIR